MCPGQGSSSTYMHTIFGEGNTRKPIPATSTTSHGLGEGKDFARVHETSPVGARHGSELVSGRLGERAGFQKDGRAKARDAVYGLGLGWMNGPSDRFILSSGYRLVLGRWMQMGASPDAEALGPCSLPQPGLAVRVRVGSVSHSGQAPNGAWRRQSMPSLGAPYPANASATVMLPGSVARTSAGRECCCSAGVGTRQAPRSSSPDLLSRLRRYPCPHDVLLAAQQDAREMAAATPPCPVLPLPLPRYFSNIDEPRSVHAAWQLSSAVVQEPPAKMRAPVTYRSRVPGAWI
ncbi:hypothetical protein PSPO01_07709 [Paraphaeosphaeria sporulosa]